MKVADSPYQAQVLDRALGILDLLAGESPELGPSEVSERTGASFRLNWGTRKHGQKRRAQKSSQSEPRSRLSANYHSSLSYSPHPGAVSLDRRKYLVGAEQYNRGKAELIKLWP